MGSKKVSVKKLSEENFEAIATRFKALSEVSRLRIIQSLKEKEQSVTELVVSTGLSQPNVSQHLQMLVSAKLLSRRKDGLNVLYRISDKIIINICDLVCGSLNIK